jgi:hypothetical protein
MSDVPLILAVAATSHLSPFWIAVLIALCALRGLPEWWLKVLLAVKETRRFQRVEGTRSHREHRLW